MERDLHAIQTAIHAEQGQKVLVTSNRGLAHMRVQGRLDLIQGVCHVTGQNGAYAEFSIPHVDAIEKPHDSLLIMWLK